MPIGLKTTYQAKRVIDRFEKMNGLQTKNNQPITIKIENTFLQSLKFFKFFRLKQQETVRSLMLPLIKTFSN